jgi:hypothetical protein
MLNDDVCKSDMATLASFTIYLVVEAGPNSGYNEM